MYSKAVYLLTYLVIAVNSEYVRHRNPRFIGTYTSTVTSTQVVTSLIPSSCVLVDPTLPKCRSVRYLNFPNFDQWNPIGTKSVQPKSALETTPLGWGEYLGLYAPTVTFTQTELETSIVKDPTIVVTYAIKGCRPHKMPDNFDHCEVPQTISIEEILSTSTVPVLSSSSLYKEETASQSTISKTSENHEIAPKNESYPPIESSSTDTVVNNLNSNLPTEPLPF